MKQIIKLKETELNKLIAETIKHTFKSYNMINEGLSKVLYHFTSLENGFKIAKEDTIYLQSAFAKESDNFDKKRKYYLSCTRMYSAQFGYSKKFDMRGVRIVLDGDKLSNNFKGKQINYWGGGVFTDKYKYYEQMPKNKEELLNHLDWYIKQFKRKNPNATEQDIQHFIDYNYNTDAQHHIDNESEDRLFSYQPLIQNLHEYIISIDVLLPDLDTNDEMKGFAYNFKYRTIMGKYVRIFNSLQQFNSPKGKEVDDETLQSYYDKSKLFNPQERIKRYKDYLTSVIAFITYADPNYDKKNFGQNVAQLLHKYELSEYNKYIGEIYFNIQRMWGFNSIAEKINSIRRDLSDEPDKTKSKILKMLSDYLLSIGANSFREGYLIKKQMTDDYFDSTKIYDKIDTTVKLPFIVINKYTLIIDPNKELFKYAVDWDNDNTKYMADMLAYEIMEYNDYTQNTYNKSSKNTNSMFQFLYKLFRKGTVQQVIDTFNKIGLDKKYILNNLNVDIEQKNLDYWEASNFDTIKVKNLKKQSNYNYDYKKMTKIQDKQLEQIFPKKQNNQN